MTHFKKRIISLFFIVLLILPTFPAPISAASPFIDIKPTNAIYEAAEWAFNEGLAKGFPNGTFAPEQSITEAQFIAMLIRYDCSSPDGFAVNKGEHKASGNYRYLQRNNVPLSGLTNQRLRDLPIKKGQVARMIAAFRGLDLSEAEAIQYLYINDLATGLTGKNNYKDFNPKFSMTRAEAIVILYKLSKQKECKLIGLQNKASGKDNGKYNLPADFMGDDTINFDPPEINVTPPHISQPIDKRVIEVDIEKETLIANGEDSTFITLSLKSCTGNSIPYEDSLQFTVKSAAGAFINQGFDDFFLPPNPNEEKEISVKANANPTSKTASTDGPDLTVKITAPKSTHILNDTISFSITDKNNNENMDCYLEPITVQLNYAPQPELRVEASPKRSIENDSGTQTTTLITAKIVHPGGQLITNFNGRVRFHSAEGASLSNEYVYFTNGIARTTVTSLQSTLPILDLISATIEIIDPRFKDIIEPVLRKNNNVELLYEPPLQHDGSCTIEVPEVAFIIDSSGSMLRNDPERLRVTKSEEFIKALNAPKNIASRFSSSGRLLSGPDIVSVVKPTLKQVGQSGGTNIGSGLEKAFNAFSSKGPKVAILLTDGKSSEKKALEMLKKAIKDDIKIFTIGLGDQKNLNEPLLRRLATETGGSYHHVLEDIDIGTAYQSIFSDITCGTPMPSCPHLSQAFSSPVVELRSTHFYMNTYVRQGCGDIERVILRFNSVDGDIDYDLVNRGQNYFALKKSIAEISNFHLYREGVFLAYDFYGNLVGERRVLIN